jgi:ubiquinone/menaquinone biosynthesis C-methylase UbiE
MNSDNDIARLRTEYARRSLSANLKSRYSWFDRTYLFGIQQRQRAVLSLLAQHGNRDLSHTKLLEVGCGTGHVLLEAVQMGAQPQNCCGIDLLADRIEDAGRILPGAHLVVGDAQQLPYHDGAFDLVMQFTACSSILDGAIRQKMAGEMFRVLARTGMIVWYDFWLNPTNPQARGIRLAEIRRLFPDCLLDVRRVTLAPPVARRIVPLSWTLALVLEHLRVLNSHYLVGIKPV